MLRCLNCKQEDSQLVNYSVSLAHKEGGDNNFPCFT